MYNIGDIVFTKSSITDLTFFYVVSDKFKNYFGDVVYVLESFHDEKSNKYKKFNELEKFLDGWMHPAEGLDIT